MMTEKLYRNRADALLRRVLKDLSFGHRCYCPTTNPTAKTKFVAYSEEGKLLNDIDAFLNKRAKLQ